MSRAARPCASRSLGIFAAADESKQYELLFSWLFPNRVRLLQAAAKAWWDTPSVTIPLCRLLGELVSNRGSRISFSSSSSGGTALLLEATRTLKALLGPSVAQLDARLANDAASVGVRVNAPLKDHASRLSMLALQAVVEELAGAAGRGVGVGVAGGSGATGGDSLALAPGAVGLGITTQPSALELKCASVACVALTRVLAGRFGNTSTFEMFGDTTLRDVREAAFKLALAGAPDSVATYPKAEFAVVLLAHTVADSNPLDLVRLPTPLFARLVAVVAAACCRSQATLSTPAAFTIEALATLKCHAMLFAELEARMAREPPPGPVEFVVLRADGFRGTVLSSAANASSFSGARGAESRPMAVADLRQAAERFREHDEAHPALFADVLPLLLDRMLTSSDADLPNMYALARPIVPLSLCAPRALREFVARFVAAQAAPRQQEVAESFVPLLRALREHETHPGATSAAAARLADLLRQQETVPRDLCRFARKWRESFSAHLKEGR